MTADVEVERSQAHVTKDSVHTANDNAVRPAVLQPTAQRLADILPGTATSPTQAAVRNERQIELARALEQLPEDYREVIVLRHLEGLSHEEFAARLGRNPGAVRMLWVRALARLRAEMQRIEAELATRAPG